MTVVLFIFSLLFSLISVAQQSPLIPTKVLLTEESKFSIIIDQYAGGESFGGGDSIDSRQLTAWFYGDAPISVCYQLNDNFGLEKEDIEESIKKVFSQWSFYFSNKKIGQNIHASERINTNFHLQKKCLGKEDLVLYLGTGPIFGNLDDLKARQQFTRPSAYVNKTHISEDFKWSKGYIRFVEPFTYHHKDNVYFPDWNQDFAFYNILLHEVGHVLGFVHSSDTIMKIDISKDHFINTEKALSEMQIDQDNELFPCRNCDEVYNLTWFTSDSIKRIIITDKEKIFFITKDGLKQEADIKDTLLEDPTLHLLSFFNFKDYQVSSPILYFLSYENFDFTLEVNGTELLLREHSRLIARFKREGF